MDRRALIHAILATLIAAPLVAGAQTPTSVRRIGWLSGGGPEPPALQQEINARLRDLGWAESQNLLVERRYANGRADLLQSLAEELVRSKVELIATVGTQAALAAKHATASIPIVMFGAGDPVRSGLVASLSRPGGNVTGYSIVFTEVETKGLTLLREVLPAVRRVGVLSNPSNPSTPVRLQQVEPAYRALGMEPIIVAVSSEGELENAVAEIARQQAAALVVVDDALFFLHRVRILNAATRNALPTLVTDPDLLEAGGMLSYSIRASEQYRRYAAFVDRILRGARPADLPIEQPTQFDLGINLKTAKALRVAIPQSVRMRATQIIE